jgi:hypothetical protein
MTDVFRWIGLGVACVLLCGAGACGDSFVSNANGGSGGSATGGGSSTSNTASGTSSGSGGAGGASASGGSGGAAFSCTPGEVLSCYDGPSGTESVGVCVAGTGVCNAAGDALVSCDDQTLPLPEVCATAEDEDCNGQANDRCATWATFIDTGSVDLNDIVADASGNAYVAGRVSGSTDIGGNAITNCVDSGNWQTFVAKLDSNGAYQWARCDGAIGSSQTATGVAVDPAGNVFASGYYTTGLDLGNGYVAALGVYDGFFAKLDSAGNFLWEKRFGQASGYYYGRGIEVDANNNVVAAGTYDGSLNLGAAVTTTGSDDVFVVKFDNDGNHVWTRSFGTTSFESSVNIAVAPNGDVILAFESFGSPNLTMPLSDAGKMVVVARLSSTDGAPIWSTKIGGNADQDVTSVAVTATAVAVAGYFDAVIELESGPVNAVGAEDMYVAWLDPSTGVIQRSRTYGVPTFEQYPYELALDSTGRLAVGGSFEGSLDFGGGAHTSTATNADFHSAMLFQLGSGGDYLWSRSFGDVWYARTSAVTVGPSDAVYIGGSTGNYVDLGTGPLGSSGMFVARIAP